MLGVAFDRSGDLWFSYNGSELEEIVPPISAGKTSLVIAVSALGTAFDHVGNMYVGAGDGVDVYRPPFSASMTKTFTINAPQTLHLAFDAAGQLYVTCAANHVLVFAPPFSSASTPIVTLPFAGGAFGVAIGP